MKAGDHIAWERFWGHVHHAIVVRVEIDEHDPSKTRIVVINWTKPGNFIGDGWGAIKIVEESISAEVDQDSMYRVDYPEDVTKANDSKLVLARARARIGDTGYGLLSDNCESFANYCKTGSEVCHQAAWLAQKGREILDNATYVPFAKAAAKEILGGLSALAKEAALKEAPEEMIEFFVREATSKVVASLKSAMPHMTDRTAKELAKQYVENSWKVTMAESLEKMKSASDWVGVGVVFALEFGFLIKDVSRIYKDKKAGKLSRRDWIKEATQRTSEGTTAAIVTSIGSLLGSCTPLGPFFGSVIGGAIGSYFGKHLGTVIGNPLGRLVARQFDENKMVRGIDDLKRGDHISFKHDACPYRKCHAIVTKRESENNMVTVIRDTHRRIAEEQLNINELADLRIEDETDACIDPNKIVEYAGVKKFEDYLEDDIDSYRCKDFARECRLRANVL